jgi:hypothetical protein
MIRIHPDNEIKCLDCFGAFKGDFETLSFFYKELKRKE